MTGPWSTHQAGSDRPAHNPALRAESAFSDFFLGGIRIRIRASVIAPDAFVVLPDAPAWRPAVCCRVRLLVDGKRMSDLSRSMAEPATPRCSSTLSAMFRHAGSNPLLTDGSARGRRCRESVRNGALQWATRSRREPIGVEASQRLVLLNHIREGSRRSRRGSKMRRQSGHAGKRRNRTACRRRRIIGSVHFTRLRWGKRSAERKEGMCGAQGSPHRAVVAPARGRRPARDRELGRDRHRDRRARPQGAADPALQRSRRDERRAALGDHDGPDQAQPACSYACRSPSRWPTSSSPSRSP